MAVTDTLDGFAIDPDPRRVRGLRTVVIGMVASGVLVVLLFASMAIINQRPILLAGSVAYVLFAAPMDWVFWRVLAKAPLLKADSASIVYSAGFKTTRVSRAELSMIFQGQTFVRGRSSGWLRTYQFTVGGGRVAFTAPEIWFRPDDMAEFARRLNVPLRGDFSEQVHDSVSVPTIG